MQVEVRLEGLDALEGAIDVGCHARGELAFEHVDHCGDFRTDAVGVIGDQARAEAQQRLDLGGVRRCAGSRAKLGRVAVVLPERGAALEIDLQRILVPERRDPEHLVEALPAQDGRTGRGLGANVDRTPAEILRTKRVHREWCDEACEVRHTVTLASWIRACRETMERIRRLTHTATRSEKRALTPPIRRVFLGRMHSSAGLPVRAGLHPTGLYLALRQIGPGELRDAFMQETIARLPAHEWIVHIAEGRCRPGCLPIPRRRDSSFTSRVADRR